MERLDFSNKTPYSAAEACIHLNRYAFVKPFCKGARVLDAACGQGYGSYLMKIWGAEEVVGIDVDPDTVHMATSLFSAENLSYCVQTVEKLPYEDESFDLVVSFETMEHLDHPELFMQEVKRVLKPGGTVIISCPNDNYYYENDCGKNPFHKRMYTFYEFKELTEQYFGDAVKYFFAFALDGFVNIPQDKCTEPEQRAGEDALGLLRYEACGDVVCVPQERYLNKWNANYYIGVWGKTELCYRISAAIAPRATFVQHKDEDYDFLRHAEELQRVLMEKSKENDQVQMQMEEVRVELAELKQKLEGQVMANARLSELLELTRKEREQLRQYSDGQVMANARLSELLELTRKERAQLQQHSDGQAMANARLSELLELTRKERDQLQQRVNHMPGIRAKNLIYRVLRKVKHILKRILKK